MNIVVAFALGFAVGTKAGRDELESLSRSVKALYETDEFADVVAAARSQVALALHELAGLIEGVSAEPVSGDDLLAKVRQLVGRD